MGSPEAGAGLYRLEVTSGPGSGVKILNQPPPAPYKESVKVGEQNLYTRAKELVGDRDPRENEFSIQMRAMDADKTGSGLGLPVLVALCGSLLCKNTRGGTIIVGALNLGGSIEMMPNATRIAELAIDKQAQTLLIPVAARWQLNDLPDDLWTRWYPTGLARHKCQTRALEPGIWEAAPDGISPDRVSTQEERESRSA
jgi:ATP-dependent Lon protease